MKCVFHVKKKKTISQKEIVKNNHNNNNNNIYNNVIDMRKSNIIRMISLYDMMLAGPKNRSAS